MLPYKSIIRIDRSSGQALYLQISNEILKRITEGVISSGHKLPSSRQLSELLQINRRTVIAAYEELETQGWIETIAHRGSFVSDKLPLLKQKYFLASELEREPESGKNGWLPNKYDFLTKRSDEHFETKLTIDAGYPDVRLAPARELSRNLNALSRSKRYLSLMNYSDQFSGDVKLREALIQNLAETRSIHINLNQIFVTRGSLMAFNLLFQLLLEPGDSVVAQISFKVVNQIIEVHGGQLVKVGIDDEGIDVDAIEAVCQQKKIRAVFVMPHHNNPTTVTLSAKRRMKLLTLAQKYQFAIIEDDYDYDFHFNSSPILPMISADRFGNVIYVGSLSKTIAPGLRMGYVVASEEIIQQLSALSRIMDCHGNHSLERAVAVLYQDGDIRRYLKKSLRLYRQRRDLFCQTLQEHLGDKVQFQVPEGGLAVWVHFTDELSIRDIRQQTLELGLRLPKTVFQDERGNDINAIRMGFASLNDDEMNESITVLAKVIGKAYE
ncbi:MAG: PLP-dependent aminotransferase family protein [Bacteroidota bacterium]